MQTPDPDGEYGFGKLRGLLSQTQVHSRSSCKDNYKKPLGCAGRSASGVFQATWGIDSISLDKYMLNVLTLLSGPNAPEMVKCSSSSF